MSAPYFNADAIRNFERIPQSITDRQAIDSVIYNIMEGIAQLVALQGGNADLSDIPESPKFSANEQSNNTNVLLCSVLEELQKMNHKLEVILS